MRCVSAEKRAEDESGAGAASSPSTSSSCSACMRQAVSCWPKSASAERSASATVASSGEARWRASSAGCRRSKASVGLVGGLASGLPSAWCSASSSEVAATLPPAAGDADGSSTGAPEAWS